MPIQYEAKRVSGTDLGKTIAGLNRDGDPFNGPLVKVEHMPDHTVLIISSIGQWAHPNALVTITGQPSPPPIAASPAAPTVLCGHNGGQGIGSGHTCTCTRTAGHPLDSDRPHGCSCFALWAN